MYTRNEKLFVVRRRSAGPAVQQEHIFLILDHAEPVLEHVCLVDDVLRMSSSCSISLARSRSLMLLISAAYAELLIVPLHDSVTCSESLGPCVCCTVLRGSFAVVLCSTWYNDASIVLY